MSGVSAVQQPLFCSALAAVYYSTGATANNTTPILLLAVPVAAVPVAVAPLLCLQTDRANNTKSTCLRRSEQCSSAAAPLHSVPNGVLLRSAAVRWCNAAADASSTTVSSTIPLTQQRLSVIATLFTNAAITSAVASVHCKLAGSNSSVYHFIVRLAGCKHDLRRVTIMYTAASEQCKISV
jgi:hypothetical protein